MSWKYEGHSEDFLDWNLVWERLQSGLQDVIGSVLEVFPDISPASSMHTREGKGFEAYVSLMFDRARGEHEDVMLYFRCVPTSMVDPPPVDVDGEDVDFLLFEIATPTDIIAALEPVVLPPNDPSVHRTLILDYVARSIALAKKTTPKIVEELKDREAR